MSEPRFYVREHVGVPIPTGHGRTGRTEKASYYVLDRLYNCAVVATFENGRQKRTFTRAKLKYSADKECARLNEWWRVELRRG